MKEAEELRINLHNFYFVALSVESLPNANFVVISAMKFSHCIGNQENIDEALHNPCSKSDSKWMETIKKGMIIFFLPGSYKKQSLDNATVD